jgi:hypothetical protein
MPNKASFVKLYSGFEKQVHFADDTFLNEFLMPPVSGLPGLAGASEASEVCLLRLAVAWEAYRSDWHIAAVNRDPSTLLKQLQQKALRDVIIPPKYTDFVTLQAKKIPRHLNIASVKSILDSSGRNVTFSDRADAERRAKAELAPSLRAKILSLPDDWRLIELLMSFRNLIVHRSSQSVSKVNQSIQSFANASPIHKEAFWRKGNVSRDKPGRYLVAGPPSGPWKRMPRVVVLGQMLIDLGKKL